MEGHQPIMSQEEEPCQEPCQEGRGKCSWRREVLFLTMFVSNMLAFISYGLMAPLFPAKAEAKGVSYTIQVVRSLLSSVKY